MSSSSSVRRLRPTVFILIGLLSVAPASLAAIEKIIYTFHGSNNGVWGPVSKLVLDSSGRRFGNTQHGGSPCSAGAVVVGPGNKSTEPLTAGEKNAAEPSSKSSPNWPASSEIPAHPCGI